MTAKNSDTPAKPRTKPETFEEFMKGDHALLHLDSRKPGVELPQSLMNNHTVSLKLSYLFNGETTHDEVAVTSFLRFSGNYFKCVIPWNAIWGMSSSTGAKLLWPDDLPKEVVVDIAKAKFEEFSKRLFGKKKPSENLPAEVPKQNSPAVAEAAVAEPAPIKKKEKPGSHLKRIK